MNIKESYPAIDPMHHMKKYLTGITRRLSPLFLKREIYDDILEALYNAGVIYKPEHTNDGQNYKPIKYKKWAANDSLPASLL